MEYKDLKNWFLDFFETNKSPVPLFWDGCKVSTDIKVAFTVISTEIEEIISAKPDKQSSKMIAARQNKNELLKIKQAIENNQHDISFLGYGIEDKWKI